MRLTNPLRERTPAATAACEHLEAIGKPAEPRSDRCQKCGATASIRLCLTCGHVGCCDSSRGHATAHARGSGHPVIRSLPLGGGSFTYCYEGDGYV